MTVIERDLDGSPKIILATREEMEKAGYSIAAYDVGDPLGVIEGVLGISVNENRNPPPAVYKKYKPPKEKRGFKPT